ncbi:hypothetical protein IGL98_001424 [Enterococcus sp. DIV0840]|uniref:DUF308 domain-containing protein n=1 Tax=Enterococcus TaxID=1350 RepID=UPI001A8C1D02|nr:MULTISPECIES: DUF308 domain-containing protein [Enterococcus]MBO0434920.1 DUF308 domain-containing protein [Enterococcus sp. DIV0849a]MBO0474373.1 DUF308 domain-containing protein [Enterococcus ureasiticus]
MTRSTSVKIGAFIIGIIFIWVSIVTIKHPVTDLTLLVVLFSIVTIAKGIFELYTNQAMKNWVGLYSKLIALIGVVDLLIGSFFIFHLSIGKILLPFVFVFWFVFNAISRFLSVLATKEVSSVSYWFLLTVNALGVITCILLFFHPMIAALTLVIFISFTFLVVGIFNIRKAFK